MTRLLVLDDNQEMLDLYRDLLEDRYEVLATANPFEAMQALEANPGWFDAAVFDLKLPGLSGVEVLHQIRSKEIKTPVVLCTGFLDRANHLEQFDAVVEKTSANKLLLPSLERVLLNRPAKKNGNIRTKMLKHGIENLERYLTQCVHPLSLTFIPDTAPNHIDDPDHLLLWFSWYQIRGAVTKNNF